MALGGAFLAIHEFAEPVCIEENVATACAYDARSHWGKGRRSIAPVAYPLLRGARKFRTGVRVDRAIYCCTQALRSTCSSQTLHRLGLYRVLTTFLVQLAPAVGHS